MLKDIELAARRSADTLIEDALGVVALVILLFGALLLPGLL